MTTAHRPTFDPARGKDALRGPAYHQRLLPAHTQLKFRKAGQGGDADTGVRDLRTQLLAAEAAHFAKRKGGAPLTSSDDTEASNGNGKRPLPIAAGPPSGGPGSDGGTDDGTDAEAKRRRILEETRDIDADDSDDSAGDDDDDEDEDDAGGDGDKDDGDGDESSSDEDSDDEDAELQRELARVRRERQEKREKEGRERAAVEEEARVRDIALGNPLLHKTDFNIKRRWDDDVVFKNQARGTEERGKKKEFVNDMLRSDFHKRFMSKYVR